jgi:hypothetical protein
MDRWLNDGPGLAYVDDLCTWVVVNNKGELISWTDDPAELAWLSLWVLGYEKKAKLDLAIASNTGGRKLSRVSSRRLLLLCQ